MFEFSGELEDSRSRDKFLGSFDFGTVPLLFWEFLVGFWGFEVSGVSSRISFLLTLVPFKNRFMDFA